MWCIEGSTLNCVHQRPKNGRCEGEKLVTHTHLGPSHTDDWRGWSENKLKNQPPCARTRRGVASGFHRVRASTVTKKIETGDVFLFVYTHALDDGMRIPLCFGDFCLGAV